MRENIFKIIESDILKSNLSEVQKNTMLKNVSKLREKEINIMITGATGSGKSSTINALFENEVAKVGITPDPETMTITKYKLNNLILWDSPGLGDGKEADNKHAKNIIDKLNELDENGNPVIDLVLVVLEAGSRDLGTSYELINNVIIPNLGKNSDRILVALNQADMAMKGRNWNHKENKPESELIEFLEGKVESIKRRINEATGVDIEPIYYSAGYKDRFEEQNPYNLSKLLYFILQHTPEEKRVIYANNISERKEMWEDNDDVIKYNEEIKKSIFDSIVTSASKGAEIGGNIGAAFGEPGRVLGKAVGGVVGGVCGFIGGLFCWR